MPLSREAVRRNATTFAERWQNVGSEKSDGQMFMRAFLAVFGIEAENVGTFEERALRREGKRGFADYLWPGTLAIEMKSKGKDLDDAYQQLEGYVLSLTTEKMPGLLMVSDFENIVIYHRTSGKKTSFKTQDLCDYIDHFHELAGIERHYEIDEQFEVNVQAAEKMANLHDALHASGYDGHELEVYLVRLLFCLFAEDTGIFPQDYFLSFVKNSKEDGSDLAGRMMELFDLLNMSEDDRAKATLLSDDMKSFVYIDGGLFKDRLRFARFNAKMRLTLINCCEFDWSKISPAIFGAMFQGVMNKNFRREIGAHYTSVENILKVVDPLFMDDLRVELKRVKSDKRRLSDFHEKIAKLKFLDPACGCGNFLMIAYRELRMLEIEIVRIKKARLKRANQKVLDISMELKVNVEQFYGIEIEDFPCEVARVSLWLMDHLMNRLASKELGQYYVRLPLTQSATIVHGNALRIDWESLVAKDELSFIMSNPPYVGYSFQKPRQKEDLNLVLVDENGKLFKDAGKMDYVAGWYYKAAKYISDTQIGVAFVSTNSITQGELVAILWKPLLEVLGVYINFAYRRFKWTNEAKGKAAVHCVIIGFSLSERKDKVIYDGEEKIAVKNISPYLVDGPNILVASRTRVLCDSPDVVWGNKPVDGGNLIIEADEYDDFIANEPDAVPYIRRFVGAVEYINNLPRYCLWLVDVSPTALRKLPLVMERIEKVRQMRLASPKAATQKSAETPTLFQEIRQPHTDFIIIPSVSSEKRRYIPIGFLDKDVIVNNAVHIIPNATLYHFGMLTSIVHMAWMRQVCGRLEIDYRYSKDIVYNNFPWPEVTDTQKVNIETLARAVLDAREKFPDSSLADLYDPLTMPPELLKAHRSLDTAVMKQYNFKGKDITEAEIVAKLMERYQGLVK